ncbi:uncharacterized protein [Macrobrachium rosenbergii]|uniref:uncharacterized protein n=1 Tax=Macrobrachium rosenbergii TaxID=79674 RepID=UPI0034D79AFF
MEEVLQKQEAALNQLQKQEAALSQLKDMQEKQGRIEDKLQEMQEKLEHVENNLQEIHQEVKDCLGREDLESFKNISSAGQQELESSLLQEISGVISLLETGGIDECSEGSHNCGDHEAYTDKFSSLGVPVYPVLHGMVRAVKTWTSAPKGRRSAAPRQHAGTPSGVTAALATPLSRGMDEPVLVLLVLHRMVQIVMTWTSAPRGKAECSPQAACRNSVRSYSCSCNPLSRGWTNLFLSSWFCTEWFTL